MIADETQIVEQPRPAKAACPTPRWLVFRYAHVTLFSLKSSRATSTAGKTLLIPTPYSIKMAFLDAALRHRLAGEANAFVRDLRSLPVRIGVPEHACVNTAVQRIRQEAPRERRRAGASLYNSSIGFREFVHATGELRVAVDSAGGAPEFIALLLHVAPAINYFGRRGSFVQYLGGDWRQELDATFTSSASDRQSAGEAQMATLDDFGPSASFRRGELVRPTAAQARCRPYLRRDEHTDDCS